MAWAIRGKSCEWASLPTFLLGITIHEQQSQIRVALLFSRNFCNGPEPVKILKMGHGKDTHLQVYWDCEPALVIETSLA